MTTLDDARVMTPADAAGRLGCSTHVLVRIVIEGSYAYTSLGGRPGDRGRNRWGLTPAQFRAVLAGQARRIETPAPKARRSRVDRERGERPGGDVAYRDLVRAFGRKGAAELATTLGIQETD